MAKTRARAQTARMISVSVWASSTAWSKRCTAGSSCRMLSIRHSIGKTPLLEHIANHSKSLAHFRCYAIPPLTGVYARLNALPDSTTLLRGGLEVALAHVERLDHLGLIASLIKDVGLIDMIDTRLVPDEQEEITPGEAMAGMILNG